jgi:MoaA/NifB/PqqE/SkfB family radical SAM enzyme
MFYKNIKELQIENTSICNAACPMCLRENTPDDKSWFEETYLPTEFFKKRIPDYVMQQVERILFNGVLGDPAAAPNFIDVCDTMLERGTNSYITISTNGGLRNEEFWTKLAKSLTTKGRVIFAIDGLADTNHIYRVNVSWNKVIKNVTAFIKAGGHAEWQFITFKHNEHQVDEARQLAETIGFKNFFVKSSHRFTLAEMTAQNKIVEAPAQVIKLVPKITLDQWHDQSNHSKISCYAKHNSTIYIEYTGKLFPCCPLSSRNMYGRTINFKDGWEELWKEYGDNKINLNHHDWDSIVQGSFFQGVQTSWNKDYANGRLAACAGVCSDSKVKFNDKNGSN